MKKMSKIIFTSLMLCNLAVAKTRDPQAFSLEQPTSTTVKQTASFLVPAATVWAYLNTLEPHGYWRSRSFEFRAFPSLVDKISLSGTAGLFGLGCYILFTNDGKLQSAKQSIKKAHDELTDLFAIIDAVQEPSELFPRIEETFALAKFPLASAFEQLHNTYVSLAQAQERLLQVQQNADYATEAMYHLATIAADLKIITKGKQFIQQSPQFQTQLQGKHAEDSIAAQQKISNEINGARWDNFWNQLGRSW